MSQMRVPSSPCPLRLKLCGDEHLLTVPILHRVFLFQIHVVHYNTKYDSFKEAMVQPDGLAVLGAFLEVSPVDQPGLRRDRSRVRMGLGWAVRHSMGNWQRCKCSW